MTEYPKQAIQDIVFAFFRLPVFTRLKIGRNLGVSEGLPDDHLKEAQDMLLRIKERGLYESLWDEIKKTNRELLNGTTNPFTSKAPDPVVNDTGSWIKEKIEQYLEDPKGTLRTLLWNSTNAAKQYLDNPKSYVALSVLEAMVKQNTLFLLMLEDYDTPNPE